MPNPIRSMKTVRKMTSRDGLRLIRVGPCRRRKTPSADVLLQFLETRAEHRRGHQSVKQRTGPPCFHLVCECKLAGWPRPASNPPHDPWTAKLVRTREYPDWLFFAPAWLSAHGQAATRARARMT